MHRQPEAIIGIIAPVIIVVPAFHFAIKYSRERSKLHQSEL